MPHFVYILFSQSADRFYIGETCDVAERLIQHNSGFYKNAFTKQAADWTEFLKIECQSRKQAIEIENFIKKMRNRNFYLKIKENPSIVNDLLRRFSA